MLPSPSPSSATERGRRPSSAQQRLADAMIAMLAVMTQPRQRRSGELGCVDVVNRTILLLSAAMHITCQRLVPEI